jgi:hypothetical protein
MGWWIADQRMSHLCFVTLTRICEQSNNANGGSGEISRLLNFSDKADGDTYRGE